MGDEDRITLTEAGKKASKEAVIDMMAKALSAAEMADWQELENHSVLTSYEIDKLLFYMRKAGIITITPGGGLAG